ncbi:hypothetical protein [Negadavirga shengliensis]|uniref:NIPSNAP domain-containing protein n=1 Tax=Negadavirga shengliensis TaxID=1389218 RepID=A0ABV9T7R6_9BACT
MFIVRDIFYLEFGQFRSVKELLEEYEEKHLPDIPGSRILTDFTGDSYRLIMEQPFASLEAYEKALQEELGTPEWQEWYVKFKRFVKSSHREILRQIK